MQVPAWSFPIGGETQQTLEWLTSVTGRVGERRRRLRLDPRISLGFQTLVEGRTRRHLENLLITSGSARWDVPLVMFGAALKAHLPSGTDMIPVQEASEAFTPGSRVLIVGEESSRYEVLVLAEVQSDVLLLDTVTSHDWPAGTRLYPLRYGRLARAPNLSRFTSDASPATVSFLLMEAVNYSEDTSLPIYRDHPVLEVSPVWTSDPEFSAERELEVIDVQTGPQETVDLVGEAVAAQKMGFALTAGAQVDAFVGVLHRLSGRYRTVWIPTWAHDLRLAAAASSSDVNVDVEWSGLSAIGLDSYRRDVRIELFSGDVFYRRISNPVLLGDGNEQITLDSPLGMPLSPSSVQSISFIWKGRLDADLIALRWWDHETVLCDLKFRGLPNDD